MVSIFPLEVRQQKVFREQREFWKAASIVIIAFCFVIYSAAFSVPSLTTAITKQPQHQLLSNSGRVSLLRLSSQPSRLASGDPLFLHSLLQENGTEPETNNTEPENPETNDDETDDCPVRTAPLEQQCNMTLQIGECKKLPLMLRYCGLQGHIALRILWYFILLVVFILLLWALANTADQYFSPSLIKLTELLRLPPNVAGVTLLAMGNNAPDLSSIIVGTLNNSSSIGIGAPVGGGMFLTCFVFGCVTMFADVKVTRRPFIRDILFYLAAVGYTTYMFFDRKVYIWESLLCFVLYGVYVATVFVGRLIYVRLKRRRQEKEAKKLEEKVQNADLKENLLSEGEVTNELQTAPADVTGGSGTVALTEHEMKESVEDDVVKYYTSAMQDMQILGAKFQQAQQHGMDHFEDDEAIPGKLKRKMLGRRRTYVSKAVGAMMNNTKQLDDIIISEHFVQRANDDVFEDEEEVEKVEKNAFKKCCGAFLDAIEWNDMNWFQRIRFLLLEGIFTLIRSLTTPRIEDEAWNKWLTSLTPIFGLQLILLALGKLAGSDFFKYYVEPIPGLIPGILAGVGIVCSIILVLTLRRSRPPTGFYSFILSVYASIMSVVWIYLIADQVVACIESFGAETGFPPAVLTITFLALGNNVGDLISDVIIARAGFAPMAVGAIFGGALLNMLIGLGIAFTFAGGPMRSGICYSIIPNAVITVSLFFLVISLLSSLIIVPLCGFRSRKLYAIYLWALYVAYLVVAIVAALQPKVRDFFKFAMIGKNCVGK